jgi:hypothetical protein
MNIKSFFKGMMQLLGKCDDGTTIADVAELLYSYDIVEEEILTNPSPTLWCWPIKWLKDIVEEFVFFGNMGKLIKGQAFAKFEEIGVSSLSGTLKVFSSLLFQ